MLLGPKGGYNKIGVIATNDINVLKDISCEFWKLSVNQFWNKERYCNSQTITNKFSYGIDYTKILLSKIYNIYDTTLLIIEEWETSMETKAWL